jgi:cystathionine beta-lyase/cystathionine gamma-synthase
MKKYTQCVHSGTFKDKTTKGVNTPIYTSSSFQYLDDLQNIYPRYFNTPNQMTLVEKLRALENAEDGLIFSSGMAAISTVLFSFLNSGDHVVLQTAAIMSSCKKTFTAAPIILPPLNLIASEFNIHSLPIKPNTFPMPFGKTQK